MCGPDGTEKARSSWWLYVLSISVRSYRFSPHSFSIAPAPPLVSKLTEKSKFMTPDTMMGSMTVLSPSTVAMSLYNPGRIEIFDWKAGKHVRTLSGFGGGSAFAHALLSDGRFVAGDGSGKIRVGSVDNWSAATVIDGSTGIISMLAGKDGSFVSTDFAGNTKIWRNGTCEVTLSGCFSSSAYYGFSLAVIGRRLVVVGESHTFLVSD